MNEQQLAVVTMLHQAGFQDVGTPKPCGHRYCVMAQVSDPNGRPFHVRVSIGTESVDDWVRNGTLFQLPPGQVANWPETIEEMFIQGRARFDDQLAIVDRIQVLWENQMQEIEDFTQEVQRWLKSRKSDET